MAPTVSLHWWLPRELYIFTDLQVGLLALIFGLGFDHFEI